MVGSISKIFHRLRRRSLAYRSCSLPPSLGIPLGKPMHRAVDVQGSEMRNSHTSRHCIARKHSDRRLCRVDHLGYNCLSCDHCRLDVVCSRSRGKYRYPLNERTYYANACFCTFSDCRQLLHVAEEWGVTARQEAQICYPRGSMRRCFMSRCSFDSPLCVPRYNCLGLLVHLKLWIIRIPKTFRSYEQCRDIYLSSAAHSRAR